jgi:hypothetical protein
LENNENRQILVFCPNEDVIAALRRLQSLSGVKLVVVGTDFDWQSELNFGDTVPDLEALRAKTPYSVALILFDPSLLNPTEALGMAVLAAQRGIRNVILSDACPVPEGRSVFKNWLQESLLMATLQSSTAKDTQEPIIVEMVIGSASVIICAASDYEAVLHRCLTSVRQRR